MARIGLGDLARDRVTGFTGIVIARTEWLSNCDRLTLQPRELHEGKIIDAATFDEPHVELVETTDLSLTTPVTTGGPRPEPVRTGLR